MSYLPERIKIRKCGRPVGNLHDKKENFIQMAILKQALDHGLVLKNVHIVIKFNQKVFIKTIPWYKYRERKKIYKWFREIFFQLDE